MDAWPIVAMAAAAAPWSVRRAAENEKTCPSRPPPLSSSRPPEGENNVINLESPPYTCASKDRNPTEILPSLRQADREM